MAPTASVPPTGKLKLPTADVILKKLGVPVRIAVGVDPISMFVNSIGAPGPVSVAETGATVIETN